MKKFLVGAIALGVASSSFAQFQISEMLINPTGTDDLFEYLEISGPASTSLSTMWFLEIEGDSTRGAVNTAINLGTFSTGSNGLFLLRASTSITALDANTSVATFNFTPDLQNGSSTWMLVQNFTGTVGNDLDTDDDGVFNTTPWNAVVDSFGYVDGGVGDRSYGNVNFPGGSTVTGAPAAFYRIRNSDAIVVGNTATGSNTNLNTATGTAIYSAYRGANLDGTTRDADWEAWADAGFANVGDPNAALIPVLTPGGLNPVPEPASMIALGLGAAAMLRRRKK